MAKVKANAIMTWSAVGTVLTCAFKGGDTRSFDTAGVTQEVRDAAIINGFKQRLADAAALDKGATVAEKQSAVWELMDYYESGATVWARKSVGGAVSRIDEELVVQAMANTRTRGDKDKARMLLESLAAKRGVPMIDAMKVWLTTEEVGVEYAKLLATKRAKSATVSAEDLEAELMEESDESAE